MTIMGPKEDIDSIETMDLAKWPGSFVSMKRAGNRLDIVIVTKWLPDFSFLFSLLESYPTSWMKVDWEEDGGLHGLWIACMINGEVDLKQVSWRYPAIL